MPAELVELSFDGPAPATFKMESIDNSNPDFKKLIVTAKNHSNKPIHFAHLKLEFLDADGTVVDESQTSESGIDRVWLDAGEEKKLEVAAFFMPDEATSARVTSHSIEFADATEWQAE